MLINYKMSATYNNSLSAIARTRILSDRGLVKRDVTGYAESDIYFDFDDESLDNIFKLLMIGSKDLDNPYFGGFFTFLGKFPDQYPFFPPHVLAKTQGKNTRFHPNFYVNGKCCVSILGTWSGPPWTSCQNLGTVAQTLKSLYIANPITQEPSWEQCTDERSKIYKRIVEYRTLEVAVIQMLENPPNGFRKFLKTMELKFLELYPKYLEKLNSFQKYHNREEKSPIYGMIVKYDVDSLKIKFKSTYDRLSYKYKDQLSNQKKQTLEVIEKKQVSENIEKAIEKNDSNLINSKETVDLNLTKNKTKVVFVKKSPKKKCYTRKSPNEKASKFELGYKKKSPNGNKDWWTVYATKSGQKRWKKCSPPTPVPTPDSIVV